MQSVDLAWDNSAANYRLAFDADETDDDVSETHIPDRVFQYGIIADNLPDLSTVVIIRDY